ncbi:S41 family peptidase [Chitinimonas sp.]|uniref:S41 family peptidase n=1 Tax=Chitinimonas sp. TaxID=1934313 RepID=UPI0035ADDC40
MSKYAYVSALLAACLLLAAPAQAAEAKPSISAGDRDAVLKALGTQIKAKYVFPDVAERVATGLADKAGKGGYALASTVHAFAELLTRDLQELGADKHFRVMFDPDYQVQAEGDAPPTPQQEAEEREEVRKMAFGLARVERLPGNVGYLDLRGFERTEFVAQAYTAAMSILSGTDALILDLRRNGGGSPSSVAYLLSHFFAHGDERHLNNIYSRTKNATREYWTVPSVSVRYTKPVYVLTSNRTFSGAEECAYDFQTQKRATVVGETTGGGANPGEIVPLSHGLIAFVPTGRAINPITHSNWEHVGVKPDVAMPASQALQWAYADALRKIVIPAAKDSEASDALSKLLAKVEKGEDVREYTSQR